MSTHYAEFWVHAAYLMPGDRVLIFGEYLIVDRIETDDIETTIHFKTNDVPAGKNAVQTLTVPNNLKVNIYKTRFED